MSAQSGECQKAFRKAIVDKHNFYRRRHHAPSLAEDSSLINGAQQYAQYLASTNRFEHSNGNYGENLAMQMDSRFSANPSTCSSIK